jgi:hypothetical protein
MKLIDDLDIFHGAISGLASKAPDEFNPKLYSNFSDCRREALELWPHLRLKLKRDQDKVPIIDAKLKEGIDLLDAYQKALDDGQTPDPAMRERGRDALWVIYNMNPSAFR